MKNVDGHIRQPADLNKRVKDSAKEQYISYTAWMNQAAAEKLEREGK